MPVWVNMNLSESWKTCWQIVAVRGEPKNLYARLMAAYGEPHRHYHNLQHISDCLAEFDRARHFVREPEAVEMALWFHDAVYDPKAPDNEERSADLAEACLVEGGLSKSFIGRVRK